jgi:hypothetical protein
MLVAAVFIGSREFTATHYLGYGLGVFVIVFLGFGGYEFITKQRGGS